MKNTIEYYVKEAIYRVLDGFLIGLGLYLVYCLVG